MSSGGELAGALPVLVRKAIGDAGFDVFTRVDNEWQAFRVSGQAAEVWVLPVHRGTLVALQRHDILRELRPTSHTEVPLPADAVGAVRCHTPDVLYETLRRIRVLWAQLPPLPAMRFEHRLAAIGSTEATAIVKRRVGQDLFREMLMEYWEGKCAVTGIETPELLRASHAKPWSKSNDAERLDVYNGVLLAVHLDALFDAGLMSFAPDGSAYFSPAVQPHLQLLMPTGAELRLRHVVQAHQPYMQYHRESVFRIQ